MSYGQGAYGQQGQQGYGQQNPYGQSGNPYTQSGNPYAQQEPYGHSGNYSERPDLYQQSSSRYDEESGHANSYEMNNMNGRDPNRILNEVRAIDGQIDNIESELQGLRVLHRQFLDDPNASPDSPRSKQIDALSRNLIDTYRSLATRVLTLKRDPESGNPRNQAQVGKIDRRLKTAINQCQQIDRTYREESREQMMRQYRIVRPEASDAEVQEAVDDSNGGQIFSTALIQSDRRGQAMTISSNVAARHKALQKVEQDMMQLAQLFNDLEAMVVQQEAAVAQIEEKGEEATQHVGQANEQLDVAVKSAKAARKKKWMCLGIALLIVIIIIIVVVVAVLVTRGKTS